jgi:magnesium transporter
MIQFYYKSIRETTLTTSNTFKAQSWIFVENPSAEELTRLQDELKLDEGLLNDAIDFYEVPRVEVSDDITYIFVRVPYHDEENRSRTIPLLIALGSNFLLTLSQRPLPFLSGLTEKVAHLNTTQRTKLFIQIFSQIHLAYNHFLADINRSVRRDTVQLEESHTISNKDLIEFLKFEKTLNEFLGALVPAETMLENLLTGKYLKLYDEDKALVEDLLLSAKQLVVHCKSNLRNIVNLRDVYSTIVTGNLNRVIKLLTAVTVIITVPTMIASFYGMNVALPFDHHPQAFLGIILGTIAFSVILLIIFSRKRWL